MSDYIKRADAIEAVRSYFKDRMGKSKCDYDEELQVYVISKEERTMLTYNKGINDKLRSLPSAETHDLRTETHGVCLISKDDAMGAVQDHFNANGFKGYDDGQKMMDRIKALPSAEAEWIPFKTRPMDEEERREWSEKFGYDIEYDEAVIYTSQLPDDGQAVLTCSRYGNITIDIFENDPDYGCGFEENGDMDGIVAWMPLPKPYREDGE